MSSIILFLSRLLSSRLERKRALLPSSRNQEGFLEGFSQFKIGKGIDLGNTCDIDFADALAYFEEDPQIRVIGLYIESIKNGEKFLGSGKEGGP